MPETQTEILCAGCGAPIGGALVDARYPACTAYRLRNLQRIFADPTTPEKWRARQIDRLWLRELRAV